MKKAILLLGMTIFVAGVLFLRNADADTILIKQSTNASGMETQVQNTEELHKTEIENATEQEKGAALETEGVSETGQENEQSITIPEDINKGFAFEKLSLEEQQVYTEILYSLLSLRKETTLSTKDTSKIDKAFQCVMLDHPEIFYVDGYKYTEYTSGEKTEKIVFFGNYLYDDVEIISRQEQIENAVLKILDKVPDTEDEYQKVKYIYETIISQTEYDTGSEDNQNICSVFLNGRSVCQGYAKAVQYLLQKIGMEAGLVIGTVRQGDGHAWNLVSVNGKWYYLDATWGDAYYMLGGELQNIAVTGSSVNYDYLCVTTKQLEKTHTIVMPISMPECTAIADNYYVREGLYFDCYDEARIQGIFVAAAESGSETVTIKCSDSAVYETICEELIEKQKVFQYIQTENGTIAYTDNAEQGSITFWL